MIYLLWKAPSLNLVRPGCQQTVQFVLGLRMGHGQNKSPPPEQSFPGLFQDHLVIVVHRPYVLLLAGRKVADDLAERFGAAILHQQQAGFAFEPILRQCLGWA